MELPAVVLLKEILVYLLVFHESASAAEAFQNRQHDRLVHAAKLVMIQTERVKIIELDLALLAKLLIGHHEFIEKVRIFQNSF